jgi:hypothetical protein
MGNHYHWLLETPKANLVAGMQWFQSTYTIRFNRRHRLDGHLFQGRYKAVLVEPDSAEYFVALSDYIHLNPARAGLIADGSRLGAYPWSSLPQFAATPHGVFRAVHKARCVSVLRVDAGHRRADFPSWEHAQETGIAQRRRTAPS